MIPGQSVPLPTPGDAISEGLAWAITQLPIDQLPSEPMLGLGALGVASAVVGGRIAAGHAVHRVARSAAAREGYALPMHVRDHRKVGQLERHGNALSIPRTGSILALGATRSGKTETGKHIVSQMRADENESMIVYDHKEDYQNFLESRGQDVIRLSAQDSTHTWNLFEEIEEDSDADEVARAIFADTDKSEYFDVAGRQVFAAILKLIQRDFAAVEEPPSNETLVNYFQRKGRSEVYEELLAEDDLTGAASHLDPESSKQASGVYAAVQRQINDVFLGNFADEGDFSIRKYMDDPQGKALVLDYPYREGESTTPIFRLLIDLAAREALDEGEQGSYFILDEVAQIPHLSRLDELVNVGAGRSIQVFVTLQSVAQLRSNYGRENASAILSGLTSAMILRCDDPASVDYARGKIADEFQEFTGHVEKATLGGSGQAPRRQKTIRRETEQKEKPVFSKADISSWNPGEGVLVRPNSWAYGRVKLID
jgi:type IV secretory pathway TraG/TraD family ATPase VirD4